MMGVVTRPFNPRLSQVVGFVAHVATIDTIAEPAGTERLEDYLREAGQSLLTATFSAG